MTHQRRWEIKQEQNGLCRTCSSPAVTALYCLKHAVKAREGHRRRLGAVRRNNSLTYRLEKLA